MREREIDRGRGKQERVGHRYILYMEIHVYVLKSRRECVGGGDKVEKAGGWKGRGSLFKIMDQMIL